MSQDDELDSTLDPLDRIERLERIIANLSFALLGDWVREKGSLRETSVDERIGYLRDRVFFGQLNRYLDDLLSDLILNNQSDRLRRIPELTRLDYGLALNRQRLNSVHQELLKELHNFIYLQHAGIDPSSVRGIKLFPVRIYTSDDSYNLTPPIENALKKLLSQHGFEIADEYPPISGSWFKRMIGKTKDAATSEEVKEGLKKIKHGLELEKLHKSQAAVNKTNAEAVRELMDAMKEIENAACSIGSILIVKVTKDGSTNTFVKTLTQNEMIAIESNQAILMDPATVLENLEGICDSEKSKSLPYSVDDDVI